VQYRVIDGDDRYTLLAEVIAAEGDEVVLKSTFPDRQTERYFRMLLVQESAGDSLSFDQAVLRSLWPLVPGKRLRLPVQGEVDGVAVALDLDIEVEAIEELPVPAGRFAAAKLRYGATVGPGGKLAAFEVTVWLDAERSLPLRIDVTYDTIEREPQTFRLIAEAIR